MAEKNSIIKEALLDIKNIESALNANTKEILRGVAREEIDSVVKESLVKEIYEEEDLDAPEAEGGEADLDLDLEPAGDLGGEEDSVEGGLGDIDAPEEVDPIGGLDLDVDTDVLGGEDLDMTASSDDDVIAIYKKLSGEDEIEIVGDEIHLNISEPGEYVVKLDNETAPEGGLGDIDADLDVDADIDADLDGGEDEVDYEIEMGDDEEETEGPDFGGEDDSEETPEDLVPVGGDDEEAEEETDEIEEGIRTTVAQGRKAGAEYQPKVLGAKSLAESQIAKELISETKKYNALLTESNQLKAENNEFRAALKEFRTKLVETVIFNTNLTYATRLFLEHSTTKVEKDNILKRFDVVTTLTESKKLYKSIANELESRKPITESIENKITKGVTSSTSKQLNESTAYVDPSTKRIMDLINRVEKR